LSEAIEEIVGEVPQGKSLVSWLAGSLTMSERPTAIATQVWVPDRSGSLRLVRTKSAAEVLDEIVAFVGKFPPGAEEGLGLAPSFWLEAKHLWPAGRILVGTAIGTSQGDYVHVDVVTEDGLEEVILGKTFQGRDAASALARRLAGLLEA
jgi:hypothetical protein